MLMLIPLLVAGLSVTAVAEELNEEPIELEPITVEASKEPRTTRELAARVTVISLERAEREMVQNIDDLVRYEPGVDVIDQGSRFGRAGFSIRGIGGNRVLVEVDGVPVSDAFSIGSFSNSSRDFVDVDSLKQTEILRGPSSALFGSDAMGGVVSFVTRDPADYLEQDRFHADAKLGYFSADDSKLLRGTLAGRSNDWSAMLGVTGRQGHERDVPAADPLDYDSVNVLAKLAWRELADGALKLTVDHLHADSITDVLSLQEQQDFSALFGFPYFINTTSVKGDDERERTRLSLEQEWLAGTARVDYLRWRIYTQQSSTWQETFEARETLIAGRPPRPVERIRTFSFEQDLSGFELNAGSSWQGAGVRHEFIYGLEFELADTEQLRDGRETDLLTGTTGSRVGPDQFPLRDFPNSETTAYGIYIQDRIELGSVALIPALRWDRYQLDPSPDAPFTDRNPGIVPVELDESNFSPKFGVLWDVTSSWQVYGQYSEGFRAPPVNDVNVGFTNLQFGYTTLPNPDLKSETSRGFEAGARHVGDTAEWEVSAFHSRYDDFIESLALIGVNPENGILLFQSVNINEVRIDGVELSGRWAPERFPEGLSLQYAASWVRADNEVNDQPLNTVAPPNAVVGLDYNDPGLRWGGSLMVRAASSQSRLDETAGPVANPAGYGVMDLFGYWQASPNIRLRGGIFNLLDKEYLAYLDVAGLPADTPNLDRFQRPGRNFSLTLDLIF